MLIQMMKMLKGARIQDEDTKGAVFLRYSYHILPFIFIQFSPSTERAYADMSLYCLAYKCNVDQVICPPPTMDVAPSTTTKAHVSCRGYTGHPHGDVEHSKLTFASRSLRSDEHMVLDWEWDDRNSLPSSKCFTCSCKSFSCSFLNPNHFYFIPQDQPVPPTCAPIRPTPPISSPLLLRPVPVTTPSHRETVLSTSTPRIPPPNSVRILHLLKTGNANGTPFSNKCHSRMTRLLCLPDIDPASPPRRDSPDEYLGMVMF